MSRGAQRMSNKIYGVGEVSKDFLANKDALSFLNLLRDISKKDHFFINRKKLLILNSKDLDLNSLSFSDFDNLFWKELKSFNFQIDWDTFFQYFDKGTYSGEFEDHHYIREISDEYDATEKLFWFKDAERTYDSVFEDGDNENFNKLKIISADFSELLNSINKIEFHSNSNTHIKNIDWILNIYNEFVEAFLSIEEQSDAPTDREFIKLSRISTFSILGIILHFHNGLDPTHLHRAVILLIESENKEEKNFTEISNNFFNALATLYSGQIPNPLRELEERYSNCSFPLFYQSIIPLIASYRTEACYVLIKSLSANFQDLVAKEKLFDFCDYPSVDVLDLIIEITKGHNDLNTLFPKYEFTVKRKQLARFLPCNKSNTDEFNLLILSTWLGECTYDHEWMEIVKKSASSLSENKSFINKDFPIRLYAHYKYLLYNKSHFKTLNFSYFNFSDKWHADYTTLEDITPLIVSLSNYGLNRFATLCFCYALHWMDRDGNLRNIDVLNLNQIYKKIAIGENKAIIDEWLGFIFFEEYLGFRDRNDYFLIPYWLRENIVWGETQNESVALSRDPEWIAILHEDVRVHFLNSINFISKIAHDARDMESQDLRQYLLEMQVEGLDFPHYLRQIRASK